MNRARPMAARLTRRSFRSYNRAFKIALINTNSIIAPSVVAVVKPPMT